MYSQDLSNSKTTLQNDNFLSLFLYSQDLSNSKTTMNKRQRKKLFLYSQDLSNSKTRNAEATAMFGFCTLKI